MNLRPNFKLLCNKQTTATEKWLWNNQKKQLSGPWATYIILMQLKVTNICSVWLPIECPVKLRSVCVDKHADLKSSLSCKLIRNTVSEYRFRTANLQIWLCRDHRGGQIPDLISHAYTAHFNVPFIAIAVCK